MRDARGFTLIEILVVVAIISLLAAVLLPNILGAQIRAHKTGDMANLRWHFQQIQEYVTRYRSIPRGSGHQFVLDPWVRGVMERTEANRDRYFTPGPASEQDSYYQELRLKDPERIWREFDGLSSDDTQYAGRLAGQKGVWRSGKSPLMANDNEFMPAFLDHTIHVLMGDGTVKVLLLDPDLIEYGFSGDASPDDEPDKPFPVGPESPHPLLQKLEK